MHLTAVKCLACFRKNCICLLGDKMTTGKECRKKCHALYCCNQDDAASYCENGPQFWWNTHLHKSFGQIIWLN